MCIHINFGRNQPGDIRQHFGSRGIKLGISIPGIHGSFPEYRATLNDIGPSEDSDWFYPLPSENLERKKGTVLGAVITISFRNEPATDNLNQI
jgi:hypothetical protein